MGGFSHSFDGDEEEDNHDAPRKDRFEDEEALLMFGVITVDGTAIRGVEVNACKVPGFKTDTIAHRARPLVADTVEQKNLIFSI